MYKRAAKINISVFKIAFQNISNRNNEQSIQENILKRKIDKTDTLTLLKVCKKGTIFYRSYKKGQKFKHNQHYLLNQLLSLLDSLLVRYHLNI